MWGVDLEVDGLAIDAFVVSRNPRGLILDLPLDVAEVVEPPVRDVVKLSPLVRSGLGRVPVVGVRVIPGIFAGHIDEL
jgi:hypothetical protein